MSDNTEEVLEEARREQERQNLLIGFKSGEKARDEYDKKRKAYEVAREKERQRAKAAQAKLIEMQKDASSAHKAVRFSEECKRAIMNKFVDLDLVRARDKAQAAANKAAKDLEAASGLVRQQARRIERKSVKRVESVLRDPQGRPLREAPDPKNPHLPPKPKRGMVKNPQFWRDAEEKAFEESVLAKLELAEAEKKAVFLKVQGEYQKHQNALDDAIETAFRG